MSNVDEQTERHDVARVWLLEPNGTPTGEYRWDRKLRIDGNMDSANALTPTVWLRMADGEPGLWPWISNHVQGDWSLRTGRGVIHPVAVEMWSYHAEGVMTHDAGPSWIHHRLPWLQVHDVGDQVPDDAEWWPTWLWMGRANPNWREPDWRDTPLVWSTAPGRPVDAPRPLTRDEERALVD